jgi:hypothetical protein
MSGGVVIEIGIEMGIGIGGDSGRPLIVVHENELQTGV